MRCVSRSLLAASLWLALLPVATSAQTIGATFGDIYLSANPGARIPFLEEVQPFTEFTFHVVVEVDFADDSRPGDNFTNGLSSWEAMLDVPAEITVTDREIAPLGATNAGSGDNFLVTLGTTILGTNTPYVVATYTAQVMSASVPEDLIVTIGPADPASAGIPAPSWVEAGNLDIHPFATWSDNRLVVNCVGEDECGGSVDEALGSLYLTASQGTERIPYNENLGPFATFSLNLVVAIDFADVGQGQLNPLNGLTAWEAGLDVPEDILITGVSYFPLQSVDVQSANDNFVVGTGTRVTASTTPFTLVRLSCLIPNQTPPTDMIVTITGATPSTENLGVPLWLEDLSGKFRPFADYQERFVVNCATAEECSSTPVAVSGASIDATPDAVVLRWESRDDDALSFDVWRTAAGQTSPVEAPVRRDGRRYELEDRDVQAGVAYQYRVEVSRDGQHLDTLALSIATPLPAAVALEQNHPNPFNPRTTISLRLPSAMAVSVDVFDARGRWVTNLQDGPRPAGTTTLVWDGTDATGRAVGSGVYHYRLRTPDREQTRRMLLLR